MDYENLCKGILALDPKIRFAGVCDETGEIKYGGQRDGREMGIAEFLGIKSWQRKVCYGRV